MTHTALDILSGAKSDLLVVGCWLAGDTAADGVVQQIVSHIADAAQRGLRIRVVLDRTARPHGRSNRELLLSFWPADVELPPLLTWRTPEDDAHLKLRAKVIVADRRDALVTSANLTTHAMDLNMEMGVRVQGSPARSIADHFDLLIARGILEPYETDGAR